MIRNHKKKINSFFVIISYAIFLFGCHENISKANKKVTIGKVNLLEYKRKADSLVLNTELNMGDLLLIEKLYKGDSFAFKKQKIEHSIPYSKKSLGWRDMPLYLMMTEEEIKIYNNKLGFDSAWYFIKYMQDTTEVNQIKSEMISIAKNRFYEKYKDSIIFTKNEGRVLRYIQSKERIPLMQATQKKHQH
jgi:hypothetical protein